MMNGKQIPDASDVAGHDNRHIASVSSSSERARGISPAERAYRARQSIGWQIIEEIGTHLQSGTSEVEAHKQAAKVFEKHNISQFWHPTCIKFDKATLMPGVKHKADPQSSLRKIAIVDIGIVIDGFEVDCGQSFGFDSQMRILADTSRKIFNECSNHLASNPTTAPASVYDFICTRAKVYGFEQIAPTAGHTLGAYPTPKRDPKISPKDTNGQLTPEGWMIEVHIGDGEYGAFYENLVWV